MSISSIDIVFPSTSANGEPIAITSDSAGSPIAIHTAIASTTHLHAINLDIHNIENTEVIFYLNVGAITAIAITIPPYTILTKKIRLNNSKVISGYVESGRTAAVIVDPKINLINRA
jgi:hypothetical protein